MNKYVNGKELNRATTEILGSLLVVGLVVYGIRVGCEWLLTL